MTLAGDPRRTRSAKAMTSALMKPFSISEWIFPAQRAAGGAGRHGPGPDFGADDGIEGDQAQELITGLDQTGQAGFGHPGRGQEFLPFLRGQVLQFGLQIAENGNEGDLPVLGQLFQGREVNGGGATPLR